MSLKVRLSAPNRCRSARLLRLRSPPPKSVSASTDAARTQAHDSALQAQQQAQMRREVVIDTQTREVIFRVIDERNGQIDHQVPDEALLRMRAYNRTLAQHSGSVFDHDGNTETEA